MFQTPQTGVDTIRFTVTLTALKKELSKLNLEYENQVSLSLLNKFKKEVFKANNQVKKEDFDLEVIKISKDKSLLGYMLIKKNFKSIYLSKKQKRAKDHKREIIFTGLNQPTKKHYQEHLKVSYEVVKHFVARFKVDTIDLSLDGLNGTIIAEQTKYLLNDVFKDYINHRSNTQIKESSYYLNNPINPTNPRFNFDKIIVYDKFIKESRFKKLSSDFKYWKRFEVTIKIINEKLNISLLDDMVESINYLSMSYFLDSKLDDTLLTLQKKLLELRG